MSTITLREIVLEILQNDGVYPGDPRLDKVYSYITKFDGKRVWGVYLPKRYGPYGDYINDVKLLWSADEGLTEVAHEEFPELREEGRKQGEIR